MAVSYAMEGMPPIGRSSVMRAAWILVFVASCARKETPPAPVEVHAVPSAEVDASPSATTSVAPPSFGPPRALVVTPKLPPLEKGMMDHLEPLGWSGDSRWLGGCAATPTGTACELQDAHGAHDRFDSGEDDPKKSAALGAKLKKLALGATKGEWPFDDVSVTWTAVPGDQTSSPTRPGVLKVGVRVAGEPIAWLATLSEKKSAYFDRIHPEYVALSPDGAWLGFVAHAFAAEWANGYPTMIVPAREAAAKAYEAAAAEHDKKGDAAGAETFRKRAAAARALAP